MLKGERDEVLYLGAFRSEKESWESDFASGSKNDIKAGLSAT